MKGIFAGSVGANVGRGTRGGMVAAACVIACALQLVAAAAAAATEIHLTRGSASRPPAAAARARPPAPTIERTSCNRYVFGPHDDTDLRGTEDPRVAYV